MEIQSYSLPLTNQKVLELVCSKDIGTQKILDMGAGEGYFCKLLGEHIVRNYGKEPSSILKACDLFPETFRYDKVQCDRIDANFNLPYEDGKFDTVTCIEVIEHIEDQFSLIREIFRIVKPGGRVIMTTPNILNINSRIQFFYSGFWLLFSPLPIFSKNPVDLGGHIHPVTCYYLSYIFHQVGFEKVNVSYDRMKRSAKFWALMFMVPIKIAFGVFRYGLRRKNATLYEENRELIDHINSKEMLVSRTIILEGIKPHEQNGLSPGESPDQYA